MSDSDWLRLFRVMRVGETAGAEKAGRAEHTGGGLTPGNGLPFLTANREPNEPSITKRAHHDGRDGQHRTNTA